MKKSVLSLTLGLLAIWMMHSCGGDQVPLIQFSKYIAAYTFGNISIKSPFVIELQNEYIGSETIGSEIKAELFEFSPKIEGKTILKSNNRIEFIPNAPLERDQKYKVKFHLDKAQHNVPKNLSTFEYNVKTRKTKYKLELDGLKVANTSTKSYHVEGAILTSDYVEAQAAEAALETSLSGHLKNKVLWKHNAEGTEHSFTITNVEAQEATSKLNVAVNENLLGAEGNSNEKDIAIPAIGEFGVHSITIDRKQNNKITIYFTEKLRKKDLKGLFILGQNKDDYIYEIENNIVYLYPQQDLVGNHDITISKGIESESGKKLTKDVSKTLKFGGLNPKAEIEGEGFYVVGDNSAPLVIKTMGLNQIQVNITKIYQKNVLFFLQNNNLSYSYNIKRFGKMIHTQNLKLNRKETFDPTLWNYHQLDLKSIVKMEPGAIYNIELKFDRNMISMGCNDKQDGLLSFLNEVNQDQDSDEESSDDYYWDRYSDDYNYDEANNPCHNSYYTSDRFPSHNIIASNIGLIAKKGLQNDVTISTVNLTTAQPLAGVDIEVFSEQLMSIGRISTDGNGFGKFIGKEKPHFVVASKGSEKTYLKLSSNQALDMDMFDVGGSGSKSGIRGFIYGERGVWRPGDSIHLTLILHTRGERLPADLPVLFELASPMGQIFDKQISNQGLNGFYTFTTKTNEKDVSGNWIARFKVGNNVFEKTIKIETIKPNRIRILELGGGTEWAQNNQRINYEAMWLTGSTAANLDATVDVSWYPSKVSFSSYDKYEFTQLKFDQSNIENVNYFNGSTDAKGRFGFNLKLDPADKDDILPGLMTASIVTKVFEPSGEFSIQYDAKKFYTYKSYAGSYISNSQKSYYWQGLNCDQPYNLEIINLGPNGTKIMSNKVSIKLHKLKYDYWYNMYGDQSFFSDDNIKETLMERTVNISNGQATTTISVPKAKWGQYLIEVTDLASGYKSCHFQYFDIPYEAKTNEEKESSTILPISMDRSQYTPGQQAKLVLNAPYSGNLLVSIENSLTTLSQAWYPVSKGKNEITIPITPEMVPNVYAHITLIQPHANTINKLPIRMYGISPIIVANENSKLNPKISVPAEIKPESKLNVTVSETLGKPMTYTLAVVDEGLLGVSAFRTPNPWKHFNSKEALGVKTWDMFDDVIGAFTGVFENKFMIGGDEELKAINNGKMKRFDPVVRFVGPFSIASGQSKSHAIDIPNYVGNLKVMVIAGDGKGSFGSAEADVRVSKSVMVLATFPRVVSPLEEIELPVNVFSTAPGAQSVVVSIDPNDLIKVAGESSKTIQFDNPGDKITSFKIRIKDQIGLAKVKITAQGSSESASYDLVVPIRVPNPHTVQRYEYLIQPGEEKNINIEAFGIPATRSATLQVSGMQHVNISGRISELIRYPYGCLEQTISSVFPQLYLSGYTELDPTKKSEIDLNIKTAIERLKSYQIAMGGFAYWPGHNTADEWATIYAVHFMHEAQLQGYMNQGMLDQALKYIQKNAKNFESSASKFTEKHLLSIQAYRLYLLALTQKQDLGAMNRLKELDLPASAKIRLAIAYHLTGNAEVAKSLTQNLEIDGFIDGWYTYSSGLLDQAYLLELYMLQNDQNSAFKQYNYLAQKLNLSSYLGTQNTAYILKSLANYHIKFPNKNIKFEGKNGTQKWTGNSTKTNYQYDLKNIDQPVYIKNSGDAPIYITLEVSAVMPGLDSVKPSKNLGMSIRYINRAGLAVNLAEVVKQTDLFAEITVTNYSKEGSIPNLALTYMVPSGFEIINGNLALDTDPAAESTKSSSVHKTNPKAQITYSDIRDDRIYYYFNLRKDETIKIIQPLTAAYEGYYFVPSIKCESMYNPSIYAYIAGSKTHVTSQ